MLYFNDKNVYTKVAREEAYRLTGRAPIAVKWVDVNKGDGEEPNYLSRLVAKDYKRKREDNLQPICSYISSGSLEETFNDRHNAETLGTRVGRRRRRAQYAHFAR